MLFRQEYSPRNCNENFLNIIIISIFSNLTSFTHTLQLHTKIKINNYHLLQVSTIHMYHAQTCVSINIGGFG